MNKSFLFLLIILTGACSNPEKNCFQSKGTALSESRGLTDFTEINIYNNLIVELKNGNKNEVKIDFWSNLLDGIKTEVKDGVLNLDNVNSCRWLKDLGIRPKVTLYTDLSALEAVIFYGAESLICKDTISTPDFLCEMWDAAGDVTLNYKGTAVYLKQNSGFGTLQVEGSTDYLFAYNVTSGSCDFSNLEAGYADVITQTVRDGFYQVSDSARVKLYGKGNLFFCPQVPPVIKSEIRGTGTIASCPVAE